jgi:hypothetical protein
LPLKLMTICRFFRRAILPASNEIAA